jgi:hypothetical protein
LRIDDRIVCAPAAGFVFYRRVGLDVYLHK